MLLNYVNVCIDYQSNMGGGEIDQLRVREMGNVVVSV